MATYRWIGGAPARSQVQNYTLAGVWEASDVIRCTIGQKSFDTTAGSTTPATIAGTLRDAWNALSSTQYPEFQEITASVSGDDVILTADTPGKPFVVTMTPLESDLSAADAQTIEGVGTATTGSTTTSNQGPNDWSTAANWSAATVPVDGDIIHIEDGSWEILYGLDQSSIDPAALHIWASFTGKIGLPKWNSGGYAEYRTDYLTLNSCPILKIGAGPGAGSGRLKINVGSNAACTADVERTGETVEPGVPFQSREGTHANNVVNITRGYVGIAIFGGETATVLTLRVGFVANRANDATVVCGSGVTHTTVHQLGGRLELNANTTTVNVRGGTCVFKQAVTVTTLDVGAVDPRDTAPCTALYNSSGTITTVNVRRNGILDFSQDMRSVTVTTLNAYAGARILDPFQRAAKTITYQAGSTPTEVYS